MRYLLAVPVLGLGIIHILAWFDISSNLLFFFLLLIACVGLFYKGIKLLEGASGKEGRSLYEVALSRLTVKSFFLIFFGAFYMLFNFFHGTGAAGVTKAENDKYYVREKDSRSDYYEISSEEYVTRNTHLISVFSGLGVFFGGLGYIIILNVRSSNKFINQDK